MLGRRSSLVISSPRCIRRPGHDPSSGRPSQMRCGLPGACGPLIPTVTPSGSTDRGDHALSASSISVTHAQEERWPSASGHRASSTSTGGVGSIRRPRAARSWSGTRKRSIRSSSTSPSTGCRRARRSDPGRRGSRTASSSRSRRAATSPTSVGSRSRASSVELLVERASELGPHLGPILIQLPPDLELDLAALEATLGCVPRRHPPRRRAPPRLVVRRGRSPGPDGSQRGVVPGGSTRPAHAAVANGRLDLPAVPRGRAAPRSCYRRRRARRWADRIVDVWGSDPSGFVYFNNDGHGCALRDASVFARALVERGVQVASPPVVSDDVLGIRDSSSPTRRDVPRALRPAPGDRPGPLPDARLRRCTNDRAATDAADSGRREPPRPGRPRSARRQPARNRRTRGSGSPRNRPPRHRA